MRTRFAAALCAAAVLSASQLARAADPTATDKAIAEALFREAKELRDAGKHADACPKFAESHRLDPKPGTILNLATCYELEGRTASAWAAYTEAATIAARLRQADREKFARGKVDELDKKLSYLKLDIAHANTNAEGFGVSIDGKSITTSAGTRFPIDPGEHSVEARAWGKQTWFERVTVAAGPTEKLVAVPSLSDAKGEVVTPPLPPNAPAPLGAAERESSTPSTQRTMGFVALGAGAVGVAVGGVFGVMTLSKKSTVDEHCSASFCDAQGLDANESAKDAATVSTIAFVVAGIAVVTGVVLVITAKPSRLHVGPGGVAGVW